MSQDIGPYKGLSDSFQTIAYAARNYRGTAEEHANIANALSTVQVALQDYVEKQQESETAESPDTSEN
jgi:hypothetical protein